MYCLTSQGELVDGKAQLHRETQEVALTSDLPVPVEPITTTSGSDGAARLRLAIVEACRESGPKSPLRNMKRERIEEEQEGTASCL